MNPVPVSIRYNDTTFNTSFMQLANGVDHHTILEDIFAQWNSGSGQECELFTKDRTTRSLSVGDFVCVDGKWYRCASFGWDEVSEADVKSWFAEMEALRVGRLRGSDWTIERQLRWMDAYRLTEKRRKETLAKL